ncbi:Os03g0437401 [Oryza sativa Japonica Group]|uniref:Os03g0437401 protein n=2 Tax=Oryza sativa subsp. japonica TaxID=39947 RepID=A0A0N7KHH7_ORYSJ|nr:Os03g0437401 [Oryza sativa Japonica Group]
MSPILGDQARLSHRTPLKDARHPQNQSKNRTTNMDKQTPQPSKGSMAGSGSRWLEKGRSIKAARRQGRPGEELRTEDRAKDIGVDHVSGEELRASRDNPDNCDNHLQLHHQRRDDRW